MSTAAVTVIHLDATLERSLDAAFNQFEEIPGGCTGETVPGTVHIARINATGVSWAIAGYQRGSGCSSSSYGVFDPMPPPPVGVFEQQAGGNWTMNQEAGKPDPCPPPPGLAPGPLNPFIPQPVLQAWKIPYFSPNCQEIPPTLPGG